jgi:uncharacterized protein (DUF4415 family)
MAEYKPPHARGYIPNPHYSQEDWDEVCDNPEWTDEELANAKPFTEVHPELAAALAQSKAAKLATQGAKVPISIRLDADVIAAYRARVPGWQTRINTALRRAAKLPAPVG